MALIVKNYPSNVVTNIGTSMNSHQKTERTLHSIVWVLLVAATTLSALTEKEVIGLALEHSPDIALMHLDLEQDSIALEQVEVQERLEVSLYGENLVESHPYTATTYPDSTHATSDVSMNAGVRATQKIPGGGTVSANLYTQGNKIEESDPLYGTHFDLHVSQPLLKNGWGESEVAYAIAQKKESIQQSKEQFRSSLVTQLTMVRKAYWDVIEAEQQVIIRSNEKKYLQESLLYERSMFLVGEKSEMDTLSAALEVLRADQNLVSAEYTVKQKRKALSVLLNVSVTAIDTALVFDPEIVLKNVQGLPDKQTLLADAIKNSSSLKIVDLSTQINAREVQHLENQLLPEINLNVGIDNQILGNNPGAFGGDGNLTSRTIDPWIGVSVEYPLFQYQTTLKKKERALEKRRLIFTKIKLENELVLAVELLYDTWEKQQIDYTITLSEIAIAQKNIAYAQDRYALGEIDALAKLKAQNDYTEAALKKVAIEIALQKLVVDIDTITAHTLKRFGVSLL